MKSIAPEITYHPRYQGESNFCSSLRYLWTSRELTSRLLVRDIKARYRQSVLGILWAFTPGIATTVMFVYLRKLQVLQIDEPLFMPYPVYVLFGFTIWQVFANGWTSATHSLSGAGHLLARLNFPRESLVLASVGTAVFDFFVRTIFVVVLFLWFKVPVSWTVLLVPISLVPFIILVIGLGFLTSVFNALLRDISGALTTLLGIFFFLVPVIYVPPKTWPQILVNDINPVSAFLIAAHDLTVMGHLTRPYGYIGACLIAVVVLFVGWRIFRVAQPIIAERI